MGFNVLGDDAWRGDIHLPDEADWRGEVHPEPPRREPSVERMSSDLVTVYRATDPSIAEMIRGLLDEACIPYVRMADAATGVFGVPRHLEIVVPVDRAEEVLDLIREYVDADVEMHGLRDAAAVISGQWMVRAFALLFLLTLGLLGVAELFTPDRATDSVSEAPDSHQR